MMITICPTIDAETSDEYRKQAERVADFAHRLHIDLGDGEFTPNKLVAIPDIWWPGGMRADLHVMYKRPFEHLDALLALGPQLIIVHAEADGDFAAFVKKVHGHGVEAGVALLQETPAELILPALEIIDHVLIFSGNLGYQGGSTADFSLLEKVKKIKAARPNVEIGWDGGVNGTNIKQLADAGVDVVNVGGFVQSAHNAEQAYETLRVAAELG